MRVVVTHLKAPWPEGTKVGDIVDLPGDEVPPWAFGKCSPAADAAPAAPVAAEKPAAKTKR